MNAPHNLLRRAGASLLVPVLLLLGSAGFAVTEYEVKSGDTLSEIARDQGVSTSELMGLNSIVDPDSLRAGQTLLLAGQSPATSAAGVGELPKIHAVAPGEYLSQIARRYGVKTLALADANALESLDHIVVGQELIIPGGASAARPAANYHQVEAGEYLSSIAARYRTSVAALARLNGIRDVNRIQVGQRLRTSGFAVARIEHVTVRPGDTLSEIATANLSSVAEIVTANELADPGVIRPGQVLEVPQAVVSDQPEQVACEASWYGDYFAGRPTASGEIFDPQLMTAASHFVALHTVVEVSASTGASVQVEIHDRGPFHMVDGEWEPHPDRCIDLSERAAAALGIKELGHAPVVITFPSGVPGVDELQSRYAAG